MSASIKNYYDKLPVEKMFSQYNPEVGQEYLYDPHLDLYAQS